MHIDFVSLLLAQLNEKGWMIQWVFSTSRFSLIVFCFSLTDSFP